MASPHPIVLTVTTGRSGSSFLYRSFLKSAGDKASIYHELLSPREALPARFFRAFSDERLSQMLTHDPIRKTVEKFTREANSGPVMDFGWTMSSLIPALIERAPHKLRILVLYRHPVISAASLSTFRLYAGYPNPDDYAISPFLVGAKYRQFQPLWAEMSEFEKCLYRWYEIVSYGIEIRDLYPEISIHFINCEYLFSNPKALQKLASFCGLEDVRISASAHKNDVSLRNVETSPLGEEWRRYKSYDEIIDLAEDLGFDFNDDKLERDVKRYFLPKTLGSRVRVFSKYWSVRKFLRDHRFSLTANGAGDGE